MAAQFPSGTDTAAWSREVRGKDVWLFNKTMFETAQQDPLFFSVVQTLELELNHSPYRLTLVFSFLSW